MTAVALPRAAQRKGADPLPKWVAMAGGSVLLVLTWWVLGHVWLAEQDGLPTPFNVAKSVVHDGWSFYWPLISHTTGRALLGFAYGNGIAIGLAMLVLLVPVVERVVMQVSVASYCLPLAAIGPILSITLDGEKPITALSALFVLFATLVGVLLGLRSADQASLDLVTAYGGGAWQQLRRVRLVAALPSTLAALKVAAPTAVLGAIIGEELGGNSNVGLGYAMIASEQALDVPRTWGIALVSAAVGGVGYIALGLVSRVLTPWAASATTNGTGA